MNSMNSRFLRFLFLAIFYFFLYLPIIVLVTYSFNKALFPAKWAGATLYWYKSLFHRNDLWIAFFNSMIVSLLSITCSLIFCIACTAYTFFYDRFRWFPYSIYATIFVPEIVLAVALLLFFMALSLPLGLTTLVIAHTVMGIGYAFPLIYQRWLDIDRRLIEAAYDLGATKWQTFSTIIFPLLVPTLIGSGILIFILSFDDVLLAYFCGSSESQTLPLILLSMLRVGIAPEFNALATLLFATCAIGMCMYYGIGLLFRNNKEAV